MEERSAVDGFYWATEAWGRSLRLRQLEGVADHFFTSLPLRLRGDDGQEEREWGLVAATAGVAPDRLFRLQQVHGNRVAVVRAGAASGRDAAGRPEADIMISDAGDAALAVQVADCVPLLMADRRRGVVAAAHAGWRGTAANVAGTAVAALAREFGSLPSDLVVAHGPSIGACCYVIGEEVREAFRHAGHAGATDRWISADGEGRLRLDLWAANRDQLLDAGVQAGDIHLSRLCTASHPQLFSSYRRDGKGAGRLAAVIRAGGAPRR